MRSVVCGSGCGCRPSLTLLFVAGFVGLGVVLIRNTMEPGAAGGLSAWLRRWGLLAALAAVNLVQVALSIAASYCLDPAARLCPVRPGLVA